MTDEIRREAEAVALRVYPERHHIHMRRCYADAYERGFRAATDRPIHTPKGDS